MNLINDNLKISIPFILLLTYSCGPNKLSRTAESFGGIVIAKYETKPCFGNIVICNDNTIDTLKDVCKCAYGKNNVWDYLMINDSLFKREGSMKWFVARHKAVKEFNYPNCFR